MISRRGAEEKDCVSGPARAVGHGGERREHVYLLMRTDLARIALMVAVVAKPTQISLYKDICTEFGCLCQWQLPKRSAAH